MGQLNFQKKIKDDPLYLYQTPLPLNAKPKKTDLERQKKLKQRSSNKRVRSTFNYFAQQLHAGWASRFVFLTDLFLPKDLFFFILSA